MNAENVNALARLAGEIASMREKWQAYSETLNDTVETLSLLNFLRKDEGDTVTFICDNPGFAWLPDCCVTVNAGWNEFQDLAFRSNSLLNCLRLAAAASTARNTDRWYVCQIVQKEGGRVIYTVDRPSLLSGNWRNHVPEYLRTDLADGADGVCRMRLLQCGIDTEKNPNA